jgi:hypothetical protein
MPYFERKKFLPLLRPQSAAADHDHDHDHDHDRKTVDGLQRARKHFPTLVAL